MSSISMDIPTFEIDDNDLQNLVSFLYKHERVLNDFGAIKIMLKADCKLALKKRRKIEDLCPSTDCLVKMSKDEAVYSIEKVDHLGKTIPQCFSITDEFSFWSSLPCSTKERRPLNTSFSVNKSFFSEKTSSIYFDIHRVPKQSLLKLCGRKVARQFAPRIRRAYGPASIYTLGSTRFGLFSIDYNHEGGNRHWYIIPSCERYALNTLIDRQNLLLCLDHGQLLLHPSVLDKNFIRYHRIVQRPNEFVVLSAGVLAQSFTDGASWSESIDFALPSWIEGGHATNHVSRCQCNIPLDPLHEIIDIKLFKREVMQKYITSLRKILPDDRLLLLKGLLIFLFSYLLILFSN